MLASMKGGSIDPPDPLRIEHVSEARAASMKGGSIDPPDVHVDDAASVDDSDASMKGGSIDPPDTPTPNAPTPEHKLQ